MPFHILTVYKPSDSKKELIEKKVREELDELKSLEFLHTIQPKSDHVIAFFESFHGQSGQWPFYLKCAASIFTLYSLLSNLKARSFNDLDEAPTDLKFKSAGASRLLRIFINTVSPTGTSNPTTFSSTRTFA